MFDFRTGIGAKASAEFSATENHAEECRRTEVFVPFLFRIPLRGANHGSVPTASEEFENLEAPETIGRDLGSSGPSQSWTEASAAEDTPITPDRAGSFGPR